MEKLDSIKQKQKLSAKDLQLFQMEFDKRKKSSLIAYLLWFFLGGIGLHQAYLDRTDFAGFHMATLALFIYSIFNQTDTVIGMAAIGMMGSAIKLIYDLFFLGEEVKKYNAKLEVKVLNFIKEN